MMIIESQSQWVEKTKQNEHENKMETKKTMTTKIQKMEQSVSTFQVSEYCQHQFDNRKSREKENQTDDENKNENKTKIEG